MFKSRVICLVDNQLCRCRSAAVCQPQEVYSFGKRDESLDFNGLLHDLLSKDVGDA